ncbi:MAG: hypothetical protein HY289_13770 [Planctomycetes bacterium]|nr:hypothetical protein [Planctomycetota bacterium]
MQAKIRSEYRLWIFWTGIGFLIAMVAFALMAYTESYGQKKLITEFFSASVACGFVGIAAILLRKLQAFRLHPNSTPAKDRIVIGKWNPQSLDDFENAQKIAASGPEQN